MTMTMMKTTTIYQLYWCNFIAICTTCRKKHSERLLGLGWHSSTKGSVNQVPEEKIHHRVRIDMTKVDHFVEFINRTYFYQDVSYRTKFLKLDSGEIIEMPNVVRTVTWCTVISQYIQFCREEKFEPLSHTTLLKILEVRRASQRK